MLLIFFYISGAEDDDMSMRIIGNGYKITRPTNKIGRYKMMLHNKRARAKNRQMMVLIHFLTILKYKRIFSRFELLEYWKRFAVDGISSLKTLKYEIKMIQYSYLYTHVLIDIGSSTVEKINNRKIERSKFKFH